MNNSFITNPNIHNTRYNPISSTNSVSSYSSNMKHTLSSAPKSIREIENLDIDDDEDDNQSVQSYRTNISEITNNTMINHNRNLMNFSGQRIVGQNNMVSESYLQKNNLNQKTNGFQVNQHMNQKNTNKNEYDEMEKVYERQMNMLNRPGELIPRKMDNFRFVDQNQIQLYEEQMRQNEEEEDNEMSEILDDSNQEFVDFKTNVRDWLKLDDDIKTLQHAIAERRKRKNELTPKVLEFMGKYEIEDLNTHEGKVAYAKSMITKPMNKDYLKLRLTEYLKSMDKAEKCTKYLMENRIKEERVRLKRINPRKKQN